MAFTSIIFLFYFLPMFLGIYFLTPEKYKNYVILLASAVFYLWGAPKFFFILIASCFVDYYLVEQIEKTKLKKYLTIGVLLNIGLLVYFKYANFAVDNINRLFSVFGLQQVFWTRIALPLAISFFTFRKIAYLVDVYRGEAKPFAKMSDYFLFILFFPQFISGPITRYKDMYNDIIARKNNINNVYLGFIRFILGFAKKVFIANILEKQANVIFDGDYSLLSSGLAWFGMLIYTLQIYYDFSAYTDMAIGLGKMLGFNLPENFDFPYISQSITEFWRRWHITLGSWLKYYVYIPLGGNRVPYRRMLINLFLVFLVSGIWHGAEWTFIVWGVIQGIFTILDRMFLLKIFDKIGKYLSIAFTFLVINFSWVFFRSTSLDRAIDYFKVMFSNQKMACDFDLIYNLNFDKRFWFIFCLGLFFSFAKLFKFSEKLESFVYSEQKSLAILTIQFLFFAILIVFAIGQFVSADFQPFIYFKF